MSILLRRRALLIGFSLAENLEPVLKLLEKYSDGPLSLADACLVRMTETFGDPLLLTTDDDFRVYRRTLSGHPVRNAVVGSRADTYAHNSVR